MLPTPLKAKLITIFHVSCIDCNNQIESIAQWPEFEIHVIIDI
jgi:hypothetical protein